MIQIGSADRDVDLALLRAPGGFAWWYLDIIAPGGDGVVLIWSFGLPFLPGYARAARLGKAQMPAERPSLNLVVYRGGRPVCYLLQQYDPTDVEVCEKGVQRMADSRFRSWRDGDRRHAEIDLDLELPGGGERLTGSLRLNGVARRSEAHLEAADTDHLWTPLTGPARAHADLTVAGHGILRTAGRGYHDRNGGRRPQHEMGIERWMWGRFPLPDRELIYYLLWPAGGSVAPRVLGLIIHEDGRLEHVPDLAVTLGPMRRAFGGLRYADFLHLSTGARAWITVHHRRVVDRGPFYLRFLSELRTAEGQRSAGWGEMCVPDRVDLDRHRPLVRMRVHDVAGGNSLWLPLFSGPRRGRLRRFAGQPLGGGR